MKKTVRAFALAMGVMMSGVMSVNATENNIGQQENVPVLSYAEVSAEESVGIVSYDFNQTRAQKSVGVTGEIDDEAIDLENYTQVEADVTQVAPDMYEIRDETGELIATWKKRDPNEIGASPRVGYTINWTVKGNRQTQSKDRYTSYAGMAFSHSIDFSRTGTSKIGFVAHDQQKLIWSETSTDGFYGTLTIEKPIGSVSLLIGNFSSNEITYSGVYYV